MTGPGQSREGDDVVVARFLDAQQAYLAAAQRAGKARDAIAQLHEGVRRVDRAAEEAQRRAVAIDEARQLDAERAEAVEQVRDAAQRAAQDRTAARGRGPAARAARARVGSMGYDNQARRERIAGLDERLAAVVESIGTDDREQWAAMRERAAATLARYREDRAAAIAASSVHYEERRAALARAEAAVTAAGDQREAAAAELDARGIDPQRVVETTERESAKGRHPSVGGMSREQQTYERRARELDAEREARRQPCNGHDRER